MKIVLATKNPGKLKELNELAGEAPFVELVLAPENFDPEETGSTFVENAIIKAKEAAKATGLPALADDSGLEVSALGGRPGIRSARYFPGSDADRRRKLLEEVKASGGNTDRSAAFVCAMAFCDADGTVLHTAEARWAGEICDEERGSNGFGYDPIFYLPAKKRTAAELPAHEKNKLSHRAQAWQKMLEHIKEIDRV
ncbi:MAG TPA: RdgB/HAM1 family non-canonical purine NTP pyrophosphatase [Planktothrix sp.]|jgi:XTP/dITP diphosphohydrolase